MTTRTHAYLIATLGFLCVLCYDPSWPFALRRVLVSFGLAAFVTTTFAIFYALGKPVDPSTEE